MKNPWEMTRQEFVNDSPSKRKPSQHRTEAEKSVYRVAVKVGNVIYIGNNGDIHAEVIIRESLPVEKVIPGFVDMCNRFVYQYPEQAHKLEVEHALSQGCQVPHDVLRCYPDLDPLQCGIPVQQAVNEISACGVL